jgi:hypothetical protein
MRDITKMDSSQGQVELRDVLNTIVKLNPFFSKGGVLLASWYKKNSPLWRQKTQPIQSLCGYWL